MKNLSRCHIYKIPSIGRKPYEIVFPFWIRRDFLVHSCIPLKNTKAIWMPSVGNAEMQHLELRRAEIFPGYVEGCVLVISSLGRHGPNLEPFQRLKDFHSNLKTLRPPKSGGGVYLTKALNLPAAGCYWSEQIISFTDTLPHVVKTSLYWDGQIESCTTL